MQTFDCPTACRPVDTAPPEYENGGFILKMHRMFSVPSTPEELLENETITGHFSHCGRGQKSKRY